MLLTKEDQAMPQTPPYSAMRQIFLLVTNYGFLVILRFAAITLMLRNLQPENQDNLLYLYNLAMAMAILSDFGMRSWYFINAGKNLDTELPKALTYRCAAGIFTALAFLAIAGVKEGVTPLSLVVFAIFAANTPPADISLQTLRALKHALFETWIRLTEGVLLITLILAAATSSPLVEHFGLALMGATLLRAIAAWIALTRVADLPKLRIEAAGMTEQVRKNFWPGLSQLGTVVLSRAPIIVTPFLYPSLSVRELAVALMVVQLTQIVSSTLCFYIMPRLRADSPIAALRGAGKSVTIGILTMLCLFALAFYVGVITFLPTLETILSVELSNEILAVKIIFSSVLLVIIIDILRFVVGFFEKFRLFLTFNLIGIFIFISIITLFEPELEILAIAHLLSLVVTAICTLGMLALHRSDSDNGDHPISS